MMFNWIKVADDLFIGTSLPYEDMRGYFIRFFDKSLLPDFNFNLDKLQISYVINKNKNVLRGLHYQKKPFEEKKVIHVMQGKIIDVVVNIDKESKNYGKKYSFILSDDKTQFLLVGSQYAHGYLTKESNTIVLYAIDNTYSSEHSTGINCFDEDLGINWQIEANECIMSKQDKNLPKLR